MPESQDNSGADNSISDEFVDRRSELAKLVSLVNGDRRVVLYLGESRSGKTRLLRSLFDHLFQERTNVIPFFYSLRKSMLAPRDFAKSYLSQTLIQFIAFSSRERNYISLANEPLSNVARSARAEDYLWVRSLVDSFNRCSDADDPRLMVRCAMSAATQVEAHTALMPMVMIDDVHLLEGAGLCSEFFEALSPNVLGSQQRTVHLLSGLERVLPSLIPPEDDLLKRIEFIRLQSFEDHEIEGLIRKRAGKLGVIVSDSTIELMIQQLNHDPFYSLSILDAAVDRGSLKTFMEFERVYVNEIGAGRIGRYFDARFREVSEDSRVTREILETLMLAIDSNGPVPIDIVVDRLADVTGDPVALLYRMHSRELIDANSGFVSASRDLVLADYVRWRYENEISGVRNTLIGSDVLVQNLKRSYELMISRYHQATRTQLLEILSQFDSQSLPSSLFDSESFERKYRGMSRVQIRRAIDEESDRVRLPQLAMVREVDKAGAAGLQWRIFESLGFEAGIYTANSEVLWLIYLITSKEPLDIESLNRIDQDWRPSDRTADRPAQIVRWYVSKEGFSAVAQERLASLHSYCSTFAQLEFIHDALSKLALEGESRPASEYELVIPIQDEAELIAARTVEQIARAADFDPDAINQIKTAIIEACINAAEHGDSPDKKIYQRFAIDEDKLIITVSNKGKTFGWADKQPTPSATQPARTTRGRGLQIIRSLMDEVKFERTDDGSRLVMIKFIKRPENQ